jgi:hypothetical protein
MVVLLGRGGGAAELVAAVLAVPVAVAHGPDGDAGAGELAHVLARAAPHLVPAHLGLLVLALCMCENQCCGSGSTGSTCFWASGIRIH